jgi:hypothetical protein
MSNDRTLTPGTKPTVSSKPSNAVLAGNAFVARFKREPVSPSDAAWLNGYVIALEGNAPETPEQRPVAWMTEENPPRVASADSRDGMHYPLKRSFCVPLYTHTQKASAETLRVGASDWEEFGLAVRTVSQNCDMTDLARRGDWLQRELKARGFDIVRSSQKASEG